MFGLFQNVASCFKIGKMVCYVSVRQLILESKLDPFFTRLKKHKLFCSVSTGNIMLMRIKSHRNPTQVSEETVLVGTSLVAEAWVQPPNNDLTKFPPHPHPRPPGLL